MKITKEKLRDLSIIAMILVPVRTFLDCKMRPKLLR
jgi:hypothetical protein